MTKRRASHDLLFIFKCSTIENNFSRWPKSACKTNEKFAYQQILSDVLLFLPILLISSFVLLAVYDFHAMNFCLSVAFWPV